MFDAADICQFIPIVENILLNSLSDRHKNRMVFQAIHTIVANKGNLRIKDLKREVLIGERQLERLFREYVGASPKSLASMVIKYRSNTMELYFETENFDAFLSLLNKYPDVELLHEPKAFPWLQRGVRIFDPNGHLIEVSESMYSVACKQFRQGKSVAETAERIMHPLNTVQEWYDEYQLSQKTS